MTHRIVARTARPVAAPPVETDPAVVSSFLSDAAHVAGGFASGVAFPRDEAEVAAIVAQARRVLPVGAQSSLTGGATPRGDVVLSLRACAGIGAPAGGRVRAGAGVPLATLQAHLAAFGQYYPPVPTYDGAFVGGTISTNAAGAATFKYGSVRPWVMALTVVLDGSVLDVRRGEVTASTDGHFEIAMPSGEVRLVPVPTYRMPSVAKLSAGYFARPGMDFIDLFIGSEGTLGVVVDAELSVIARPRRVVALVRCTGDAQAVAVTAALRAAAHDAWAGRAGLDVAAIEYMDARALRSVPEEAFARGAVTRPAGDVVLLLVQIEAADEHDTLERFAHLLDACGVADDPALAGPGDERGAQRLFDLREAVPAGVNAVVAEAKSRTHADIEKTAGDMVVPFERLAESMALYRSTFERYGLDYAIWGHVSDGNLHPNVVPRSLDDVVRGREAIAEIASGVAAMGGAPLAEHGVGRSPMKQALLRAMYGDAGLDQMRAVKRALDPAWKLSPGVLFPPA